MASQRITLERLAAVERAMSPEAARQRTDIVIESIMVTLASGSMSLPDLTKHLEEVWPGAGLTMAAVEAAAEQAVRLGLVSHVAGLDGALYASIVGEMDFSTVESPLERTKQELADYVAAEFARQLTATEAEGLMSVLVDAVGAAIREPFAAYQGSLTQPSSVSVKPDHYDLEAAARVVDQASISSEMKPALKAFAIDAFDVSLDRGSRLVSALATGYVMHAIVARRDQLKNIEVVGTVASEWLLIDTPLLFTLLSAGRAADALRLTLNAATAAGVYVIVPEQCIEEAGEYVSAVEEFGEADRVSRLLADDRAAKALFQLTENIALQTWLSHVAAGTKLTWPQFCKMVYGLKATVAGYGYTVSRAPAGDPADRERFRACRRGLDDEMEHLRKERGPSFRPKADAAIYVDGRTMAMAWRQREGRSKATKFWPGAWIVTPDKRIAPAFRRANPDDEFALTISPSQLVPLLSTFTPSSTSQQLAQAAASLMSHDTLVLVASRYPPSVALQMARSLAEVEGAIDVDVRVAQQLSLDDLLESAAANDPDADTKAAASLLAQRTNRLTAIAAAEVQRLEAEKKDALGREEVLSGDVLALREQQARADREHLEAIRTREEAIGSSEREMQSLKESLEATEAELRAREEAARQEAQVQTRRQRVRMRRIVIGTISTLMLVAAAVFLFRYDHLLAAIAFGLGGIVAFGRGWPWTTKLDEGVTSLLPTFLMECLGITLAVAAPEIWEMIQAAAP